MKRILHKLILLIIGGLIYCGLEVIYRGFTHPSMFVVGGLCFVVISAMNDINPNLTMREQVVIGASSICLIEFISGLILNVWLGLHVWQYHFLDIMGQTSIPAWFMWAALVPLGSSLADWLEWDLHDEAMPKFGLFRAYLALIFGDYSKHAKCHRR
jgi:uncharacterized membrane protein